MIDIDALEALAKAATPGEWFPETYSSGHRQVCGDLRPVDEDEDAYTVVADVFKREDHEYLVAANPAAILALIAEVRALRAGIAPIGWQLVPTLPTQEMMDAWNSSGADDFKIPDHRYSEFTMEEWEEWVRANAKKDWNAMLAAARGTK